MSTVKDSANTNLLTFTILQLVGRKREIVELSFHVNVQFLDGCQLFDVQQTRIDQHQPVFNILRKVRKSKINASSGVGGFSF
jgi:hypothetical protein